MTPRLTRAVPPPSEQVSRRQSQVDRLYVSLKDLVEERKAKLEQQYWLYQLNREVDELEHWIAEKEVVATSPELGQDFEHVTVSWGRARGVVVLLGGCSCHHHGLEVLMLSLSWSGGLGVVSVMVWRSWCCPHRGLEVLELCPSYGGGHGVVPILSQGPGHHPGPRHRELVVLDTMNGP